MKINDLRGEIVSLAYIQDRLLYCVVADVAVAVEVDATRESDLHKKARTNSILFGLNPIKLINER